MGFADGAPPADMATLIRFMIYLSSESVCFCCATSLAQSAVIIWSFAAVEMFAAYSLAPNSDSFSPST